jgi:hypothetical protein
MNYSIKWYIPNRVIEVKGSGNLVAADFERYSADIVWMLQEAEKNAPGQLVYNLHDAANVESYPPSYLMVTRALPVLRLKNRGPLFLITQSRKVQSIISLTSHIMDFPIRVFATREEAIAALEITLEKEILRTRGH